MNKLIFMVGVPGCGKTTYANENLKDCEILSSDKIREELFGNENDQSNNALVFETLFDRARSFLKDGKDVVIDATNVNVVERAKALEHFKDLQVKRIAIVINTPINKCIEQDLNRNRTVGKFVIEKFAKIFTKPTKEEGFDEIICIN